MNLLSELKILLRFWLGILVYIVLLGIVQRDWAGAIVQGLLWGMVMALLYPGLSERELRKKLKDRE